MQGYDAKEMFQKMHVNLALHNPYLYNHDRASSDPLWHSCSLMEHFMKSSASTAAPLGTSALDESTARMKARTTAKTYIPNKP